MDQILGNGETPSTIKKKVFSEQVKILHNNLTTSIPGNFTCAIIIFISMFQYHLNNTALIWFAAIIAISAFSIGGLIFYRHYPDHDKLHLNILICGMTLSGLLWGILEFFLMPESPLEQMLIMVIAAGVTAGGIQTLNANLTAALLYLNIIILPLCTWLFLQNSFSYQILNAAVITYYIFMLVTCIRGYKLLTGSLYLKYENLALIEKLSVSNNRLVNAYQLLEKHKHKLILINKMNDTLQACQSAKEAYDTINMVGKELFTDFSGSLFIRTHPHSSHFELATAWGKEKPTTITFSIDDCWALRKGHAYAINHPEKSMICPHFDSEPNTSICLPLCILDKNMGLIVLHGFNKEPLTHEQTQFAHTFAEVIQLSLSNIKLRESLYQQTIHDPLTGLFNRRYMDETLTRELQHTKREKKSLCVAMLDLDHFKTFNDTYGHEAGDEILKYIGKLLHENFRGSDVSCRYGGEEFVIVMLDTDLSAASEKLTHFRQQVKNAKIYFQDQTLPSITVSIGVAEASKQGDTAITIIHSADIALYSAKRGGRDKIVCSEAKHVETAETV